LVHGEEHLAKPANTRAGYGLACCRMAAYRAQGFRGRQAAAERYDTRIEGRLLRLEPYVTAQTPILHRCLTHLEEHKATPNNVLNGKGLRCCGLASWGFDSLGQAVRKKLRAGNSPTCTYIYGLNGSSLLKVGISVNIDNRKYESEGWYASCLWKAEFDSRYEAFFLEQAILQATTARRADTGEDSHLDREGASECRAMPFSELKPLAETLEKALRTTGIKQFAQVHLRLTPAQRRLLEVNF